MNHKITFQELVDAIAEQSGKSKQFTHDFIKDLADLVKEGLEKNGSVNIAGLGKFELKKMDEREGYNPETDENITIPAHNKIDFTPYKDLRELVNAPYSHMEPEILEEETDADVSAGEQTGEGETEEEPADTASAADEGGEKKKAPWEEDMESEIEVDEDDPFGLNAKQKSGISYSLQKEESGEDEQEEPEQEEDVVEFRPDHDSEQTGEDDAEVQEPSAGDEQLKEEEKPAAPAGESKSVTQKPKFRDRSRRRQDTGGTFWIIAAAFIILLLAIGAWYFMGSQQEAAEDTMAAQSQAAQNENNLATQDQQQSQEQTAGSQQQERPAGTAQSDAEVEADTDAEQEEASGSGEDNTTEAQNADRQAAAQTQQAADPTAAPPVETITVSAGQTLWGLADVEYQNPYLWPWIYDTNKPKIDDPDIIYVGQSLDIPQRRGPNNGLSNSDSLQVALGYVETYLWYKENNLENARFYLYAAKKYHNRVFEYTDATFDEEDMEFANRAQ